MFSLMVDKAIRVGGLPELVPKVRFGVCGAFWSRPTEESVTVLYHHLIAIMGTGDDRLNQRVYRRAHRTGLEA